MQNVLPNNNYIVQNPNIAITQVLQKFHIQKQNPEKPPEDNYMEAQWQFDDIKTILQNKLHTLAWEAEFRSYMFDIPIIYTDLNARDFDETVFVPRCCFHDSSDGQNQETCPASDPSAVHLSNMISHCQSQDLETATD